MNLVFHKPSRGEKEGDRLLDVREHQVEDQKDELIVASGSLTADSPRDELVCEVDEEEHGRHK